MSLVLALSLSLGPWTSLFKSPFVLWQDENKTPTSHSRWEGPAVSQHQSLPGGIRIPEPSTLGGPDFELLGLESGIPSVTSSLGGSEVQ